MPTSAHHHSVAGTHSVSLVGNVIVWWPLAVRMYHINRYTWWSAGRSFSQWSVVGSLCPQWSVVVAYELWWQSWHDTAWAAQLKGTAGRVESLSQRSGDVHTFTYLVLYSVHVCSHFNSVIRRFLYAHCRVNFSGNYSTCLNDSCSLLRIHEFDVYNDIKSG